MFCSNMICILLAGALLCLMHQVQSESPCCKTHDDDPTYKWNGELPNDCRITCSNGDDVAVLNSDGIYDRTHFKDPPTRSKVILKKEAGNVNCKVDCPELGVHICSDLCKDDEKRPDLDDRRIGDGEIGDVPGKPDGGGWSLTSITIFTIAVIIIIIVLIAGIGFCLRGKGFFRGPRHQDDNGAINDNNANELEVQMKLQDKEQIV